MQALFLAVATHSPMRSAPSVVQPAADTAAKDHGTTVSTTMPTSMSTRTMSNNTVNFNEEVNWHQRNHATLTKTNKYVCFGSRTPGEKFCGCTYFDGSCAVSFGFIAEVVAVLMLIFHTAVLADLMHSATVKPLASLIWFVLATGFLIVILLAVGVCSGVFCIVVFVFVVFVVVLFVFVVVAVVGRIFGFCIRGANERLQRSIRT